MGHTRPKHVPTKLRHTTLKRDHHTCQIQGPYCTHTATEVDHKTPLSQGGTDNPTNLQAVCHNCHDTKTQQEAQHGRNKRKTRTQLPTPPHPGLHTTHPTPHQQT